MNKFKQFFRDNFHSLMLTIIFLSLAGSLTMLGFQSVQQTRQIEATRYLAEQIREDSQKQHDAQDAKDECFLNLFVSFINNRTEITTASINECKVSVNGKQVSQAEPTQSAPTTASKAPQAAPSAKQAPVTQSTPVAKPEEQPAPQTSNPNTTKPITIQPPILPIELRIN